MNGRVLLRYLLVWCAMLAAAMVNGALRDFTYGRQLTELIANQLSCLTGIVLLGAVMRFYVRRWPPGSARQAIGVGLFWMMLTVAFEFLFFHYIAGHTWVELLANYDVSHGRLWPFVLLWVAIGPRVFWQRQPEGRKQA